MSFASGFLSAAAFFGLLFLVAYRRAWRSLRRREAEGQSMLDWGHASFVAERERLLTIITEERGKRGITPPSQPLIVDPNASSAEPRPLILLTGGHNG